VHEVGRPDAVDPLSIPVVGVFVTLRGIVRFRSLTLFAENAIEGSRGLAEPPKYEEGEDHREADPQCGQWDHSPGSVLPNDLVIAR
jgi:hypothetical protein